MARPEELPLHRDVALRERIGACVAVQEDPDLAVIGTERRQMGGAPFGRSRVVGRSSRAHRDRRSGRASRAGRAARKDGRGVLRVGFVSESATTGITRRQSAVAPTTGRHSRRHARAGPRRWAILFRSSTGAQSRGAILQQVPDAPKLSGAARTADTGRHAPPHRGGPLGEFAVEVGIQEESGSRAIHRHSEFATRRRDILLRTRK